jgi:hypothetical protein
VIFLIAAQMTIRIYKRGKALLKILLIAEAIYPPHEFAG